MTTNEPLRTYNECDGCRRWLAEPLFDVLLEQRTEISDILGGQRHTRMVYRGLCRQCVRPRAHPHPDSRVGFQRP